MTDPLLWITVTIAGLAGLVILTQGALKGWDGWLALKRLEIEGRRDAATPPTTGQRIEIADLKERIRKLEAIAAGVDL